VFLGQFVLMLISCFNTCV